MTWVVVAALLASAVAWVLTRRPAAAAEQSLGGLETEYCAEVVRIAEVRQHPNADRLEIVRFEMRSGPAAYEVVIGRGSYRPGQLAAYLSVDCVLPLNRAQFKFLADRLDGKGKTHYRLRAARLRGLFSQGLLVDPPTGKWNLGDSVAEALGVTYHRQPDEQEPAATSGARAPKPQAMPVYGVASLKKVPNLFADGEEVVVTEKIHGANVRFGWMPRKILGIRMGWRFRVGSHRVMKDADAPLGGDDLWLAVAELHDLARLTRDYRGFAFYGEIFGVSPSGKRIQDLTYGKAGPALVVFDVRLPDGTWATFNTRTLICADAGLEQVPVVTVEPWHSGLIELAEGESIIAPGQIREGIVIESTAGQRRKAKFVGQGYLLRREAA